MAPRGPAASLLLAVGVSSAIIGPVNTFIRTGAAIPPFAGFHAPPHATRWIGGGGPPAAQKGTSGVRRSTVSLAGYPPAASPYSSWDWQPTSSKDTSSPVCGEGGGR